MAAPDLDRLSAAAALRAMQWRGRQFNPVWQHQFSLNYPTDRLTGNKDLK
jgi:hypothetical protein